MNKYWIAWRDGINACEKGHGTNILAIVKTIIFFTYIITNLTIITAVIHHW